MLGPFPKAAFGSLTTLQVCPFGVIPKGHNIPGGGASSPTSRTHLDAASMMVLTQCIAPFPTHRWRKWLKLQQATHMEHFSVLAKIDIEAAYRLIPVHPQDHPLQAVYGVTTCTLTQCSHLASGQPPKIFNAVADALEWSLRQRGIRQIFHYLDDFIVIGPPDSPECALALLTLNHTCAELGVPIAKHKREGPVTCLTFLGIEVDTMAMQLRLPVEKVRRLQGLLSDWGDRKTCEWRELESLIGLHARWCAVAAHSSDGC